MGRRIFVRWDMTVGPDDREMVVKLPAGTQFTTGELRPTVSEIHSVSVARLVAAMNDEANWTGLLTHFDYERALSGYIAAYPHRLEDGLLPHPNERVRERVFKDSSRSDVLLLDRNEIPVIVECKQGQPTPSDVKQLRGYCTGCVSRQGRTPAASSSMAEPESCGARSSSSPAPSRASRSSSTGSKSISLAVTDLR